jgi:hypothetical protein
MFQATAEQRVAAECLVIWCSESHVVAKRKAHDDYLVVSSSIAKAKRGIIGAHPWLGHDGRLWPVIKNDRAFFCPLRHSPSMHYSKFTCAAAGETLNPEKP